MARGRPRLDPIVKQHNIRETRRRYEEKNASERREASHLRMQLQTSRCHRELEYLRTRKTSPPSCGGLRKLSVQKKQAEHDEMLAEQAATKQARRTDAEALRKKHKLARRSSPSPAPLFVAPPHHPLERCPHCLGYDCIGCACMCPDSIEWFTHNGGHFYPTCELCGQECIGCSYPGHEDPHKFAGPFYAVISDEWKGAVTSSESLARALARFPGARTWNAQPWWTFQRLWVLDCTEYHLHHNEPRIKGLNELVAADDLRLAQAATAAAAIPPPSAPPPPYVSTTTPASLGPARSIKAITAVPAPTTPKKLTREEPEELAAMRPRAGPISPRRLDQQFARVLGAQAVVEAASLPATPVPASSMFPHAPTSPTPRPHSSQPARSMVEGADFFHDFERPSTPPTPLRASRATPHPSTPPTTSGPSRASRASRAPFNSSQSAAPRAQTAGQGGAVLMYAVGGHNRLFRDRVRALATLQRSPGADLLFSENGDEVFDFLAEETRRMGI
ncbi:hypothetical protein DFH09DRAFT_1330782 [Mycena vulgaris]|nr:hypothetical protein DFH09DRAFT_1330782 [Mycena vulgaris]